MRLQAIGMLFASMMAFAALASCQKEEGFGGNCTLTGRVFVQDYNSQGVLVTEYYGPDERVFIIYGQDSVYSDEMRTNYDGTFTFEHLYPGDYRVYAYSECDTCDAPDVPFMRSAHFSRSKETIVTEEIVIRK